MGMDNFGRDLHAKARKLANDFTADEGHAEDTVPSTLRAALIAAGVTLNGPVSANATETRNHDPIADIIVRAEKKGSIEELIRDLDRRAELERQILRSIEVFPMPAPAHDLEEIRCLARNIWYEAANQGVEGQKAVALVTLSRVLSKKYPNTVCGVVYQHLQYSWTLDAKKRDVDPVASGFKKVTEIAAELYAMKDDSVGIANAIEALGLTRDTLFYKRFDWDENNPDEKRMSDANKWFWQHCVETVPGPDGDGRIGDHRFYRAKAKYCTPAKKR